MGGPGDKPLTPGQVLGYFLISWGITIQTSYVESRWHQIETVAGRNNLFAIKIRGKNGNIFYSLVSNSKTGRNIVSGQMMAIQHRRTNEFWEKKGCGAFLGSCYACPKLGDAGRTRVASKKRRCSAKPFGHNFQNLA